jgi:hypothetical protein
MATTRAANELKQQGAIEASRDPESNVTAEDAERKIVEDSREAGVTAFTFDPDASPEEKKAQARAVRCSHPLPSWMLHLSVLCLRALTTLGRQSPKDSTADPKA